MLFYLIAARQSWMLLAAAAAAATANFEFIIFIWNMQAHLCIYESSLICVQQPSVGRQYTHVFTEIIKQKMFAYTWKNKLFNCYQEMESEFSFVLYCLIQFETLVNEYHEIKFLITNAINQKMPIEMANSEAKKLYLSVHQQIFR